jgi:hypothetical protein
MMFFKNETREAETNPRAIATQNVISTTVLAVRGDNIIGCNASSVFLLVMEL